MSETKIASFYSELNIKVNKAQLRQAEQAMQRLEAMMLKLKEQFGKSLVVMPKVQFNSLQFQKQIQKSLNQVSRLTEFKLDRFRIDNAQLNRSLQSAVQRAQFSANSIKIKAIVERSPLSQSMRATARQGQAIAEGNSGAGGVAGMVAASRAGLAGLAGYAGYSSIQALNGQINGVQDRVIRTDTARMLLGQSVGGSDERKSNAMDYYRRTTNKYGTDAEGGIRDFNSLLVNQRMAGTSTRDALRNWELIQQRATFAHLGADQQQRFIRQLLQIQGKNQVTQEDLSTIADSDSGFKSTLIESYAKGKGWGGNMQDWSIKYAKDQQKGLVKWADVVNALTLSAQRNAKAIEESSDSLRADAQRTANSKFWADMERNSEELTKTLEDRNKAEQELYAAAVPLQELFTRLVEIPLVEKMTSFTESLTGFAKWYDNYRKLPDAKQTDAAIEAGKDTATWLGKRLATNSGPGWAIDNNILGAGDAWDSIKRFVMGPQQSEAGNRWVPDFKLYQPSALKYQEPINQFKMPDALPPVMAPQFGQNPMVTTPDSARIMQQMTQSYSNNDNRQIDNSIRIESGAVQINGTNLNPDQLLEQMQSGIQDIARRTQSNALEDTRIQYPSIGR
ncbi:hypothetical protein [Pseudomonas oryzihabitans]|uniref:hypothetical protein n=1 Tax=Pseudomonas oryzihabitans TaxID=47885 RepID=UPI002B1E5FB2|nr:hypothetical protein [Pseudomonas oryzihabitans]